MLASRCAFQPVALFIFSSSCCVSTPPHYSCWLDSCYSPRPLLPSLTHHAARPHSSAFIRWCGLLINASTLELLADYSRYSGQHIAASLTLPLARTPGRQLPTKLAGYMRPKCHALLLDTGINAPATVRLNIYQVSGWVGDRAGECNRALAGEGKGLQVPCPAPGHMH